MRRPSSDSSGSAAGYDRRIGIGIIRGPRDVCRTTVVIRLRTVVLLVTLSGLVTTLGTKLNGDIMQSRVVTTSVIRFPARWPTPLPLKMNGFPVSKDES